MDLRKTSIPANVMISVRSLSLDPEEPTPSDEINVITEGQIVWDGESKYILTYTETDPESNEKTYLRVELEQDRITMSRLNGRSTFMLFERDKSFDSLYETEYGSLSMKIYTLFMSWSVLKDHGVIRLRYQIETDGSYPWVQEITIRFALNETDSL